MGLSHVLAALSLSLSQQLPARQVAAPPEDVRAGLLSLPAPSETAVRSKSLRLPVEFEARGDQWAFEATLPVDPNGAFVLLPHGARDHEWQLALRSPDGPWETPGALSERAAGEWIEGPAPGFAGDHWLRALRVTPSNADTAGPGGIEAQHPADAREAWTLRVHLPKRGTESPPRGEVIVVGREALRLESHLTSHRLVSRHPVGLCATLVDPNLPHPTGALRTTVERAELRVDSAFGPLRLPMVDDGQHDDGEAGDGRFGALLPDGLSGPVRATATLWFREGDGPLRALSGTHAFPMLEPTVEWTAAVQSRVVDGRALDLAIGVEPLGPASRFHVSAEVWGRDPEGRAVPVAWLSKMAEVEVGSATADPREPAFDHVTLRLDGRWLRRAGVRTGLELRGLRIQDPDTHVVHDALASLPVGLARLPANAFGPRDTGSPIPRDLLMGPTDRGSLPDARPHGLGRHGNLILAHGYCSGGSIWPAGDFTQPKLEFLDPDQNRSHDQFAQLLGALGGSDPSFGVLAHSQGGAAALHLLTYYASGLDHARGPRRIQALATPFQGTPLADFGIFACGTNFDLSVSGAALWLAGIPSWARNEVYYWTTVDDGSACSFLSNLILDDADNDGTVERFRGQLPGGHAMGHIVGWCHTTGMSDPASYTDGALNALRNVAAAR